MSLDLAFFERETNIKATVIADSISKLGQRITTFEIEYPRFILAELNTHRAISKNSSSSRAIPIDKMLGQTEKNMGTPLYWGSNKSGMQAGDEVEDTSIVKRQWKNAFYDSAFNVRQLQEQGLHKQTTNRLIEPFQMMKTVVTATDWDNFFNLRIDRHAQPEFCMLAYKMYQVLQDSVPVQLNDGDWHLPYVNLSRNGKGETKYTDQDFDVLTLEQAIAYSAASCAAVSYRTDSMTLEKADKIFDMLIKAEVIHASPFEHLATPVIETSSEWFEVTPNSVNVKELPTTWQKGITHMNKQGELCSGALRNWISYRQTLEGNTCWKFDFEQRMESFK